MAKYRQYKNGIFGHRYKGYYITKTSEGLFNILDEDSNIIQENISDYSESEWFIDKKTATENDLRVIRELYSKEIYQLSKMLIDLLGKKEKGGLDKEDSALCEWVEKIRVRKVEDRVF